MTQNPVTQTSAQTPTAQLLDPRGARFGAAVTTAVLALVLITWDSPLSFALLVAQTLVFAIGAGAGPRRQPYGWLFARLVRPRIGPPRELEDARPPRFAQAVGLAFTGAAIVAILAGLPLVGLVLTAGALIAAALNAVFGLCLGCEIYLTIVRLRRRST